MTFPTLISVVINICQPIKSKIQVHDSCVIPLGQGWGLPGKGYVNQQDEHLIIVTFCLVQHLILTGCYYLAEVP